MKMYLYRIFLKELDGNTFIFELWSKNKKSVYHYLYENYFGLEILKILKLDSEKVDN